MVAGDEHCQLRAVIEVLVPYSSPPSWLADWAPRPGWLADWRICPARVRFCGPVLLIPPPSGPAPPALHKSNLSPELPGDVIALPGAHAKIRRDGYRTDHQ
jgi:hypothetical protein